MRDIYCLCWFYKLGSSDGLSPLMEPNSRIYISLQLFPIVRRKFCDQGGAPPGWLMQGSAKAIFLQALANAAPPA